MLCFLETPFLRFALLPYYRRVQILLFCISWESENITVNKNKNIQRIICASEIAILAHPKNCNSPTLLTWLVNMRVCVNVSAHKIWHEKMSQKCHFVSDVQFEWPLCKCLITHLLKISYSVNCRNALLPYYRRIVFFRITRKTISKLQ